MIKKESERVCYTKEVVTDVFCDKCGKSLVGEDDEIVEISIQGKYFIENESFLHYSGLNGEMKELCRECLNPILKMLNISTDEIF